MRWYWKSICDLMLSLFNAAGDYFWANRSLLIVFCNFHWLPWNFFDFPMQHVDQVYSSWALSRRLMISFYLMSFDHRFDKIPTLNQIYFIKKFSLICFKRKISIKLNQENNKAIKDIKNGLSQQLLKKIYPQYPQVSIWLKKS